eukprot:m.25592 g.25592  ORF g.25592 m.25592 type:complete len:518 (+) comp7719_c0_seq1:242-1795(+)
MSHDFNMMKTRSAPEKEGELPPGLQQIEELLRCPICQDLMRNAMMLPKCSHNFCSECIRKHLSFSKQSKTYSQECPVCHTPTNVNHMLNNRTIDCLVNQFIQERPKLVVTAMQPNATIGSQSKSIQKSVSKSSTSIPNSDSDFASSGECSGSSVVKEGQARNSKRRMPLTRSGPAKKLKTSSVKKKETKKKVDTSKMATCPVCSKMVKLEAINTHLDKCLTSTSSTPSKPKTRSDTVEEIGSISGEDEVQVTGASSSGINREDDEVQVIGVNKTLESMSHAKSIQMQAPKEKRKPLAKVHYQSLSAKQLQQLLTESHLATDGNRQQKIWRHVELVNLYNSECDALQPKSLSACAREVAKRERLQSEMHSLANMRLTHTKNSTAEQIRESCKLYLKKHRVQFRALREAAEKTKIKGKKGSSNEIKKDSLKGVTPKSMETSLARTDAETPSVHSTAPWPIEDEHNDRSSPLLFESEGEKEHSADVRNLRSNSVNNDKTWVNIRRPVQFDLENPITTHKH